MKNNSSTSLILGIVIFCVGVVGFLTTVGENLHLLFYLLSIAMMVVGGSFFGFGLGIKKEKPYCHYGNLKEKVLFTIMWVEPNFSIPDKKKSARMVVEIEDYGTTLMEFPKNTGFWGNKDPQADEKYIRNGKYFRQII